MNTETPKHYQQKEGGFEPFEIASIVTAGLNSHDAICLFNVIKYAMRCNHKGDALGDLSKAQDYAYRLCHGRWRHDDRPFDDVEDEDK